MRTAPKGFSILEIILIVAAMGLLSAVGWLYFSKTQSSPDTKNEQTAKNNTSPQTPPAKDKCNGGTESGEDGMFCAEDVGIVVQIPDAFKGKIKKIDNYTVTTQNTVNEQGKIFGKSETAYQATITGSQDEYSITIAKEPLRNFRVRSYVPAIFNKDTKQIHYQDTRTDEVESVTVDGIKFYTYGIGDAGTITSTYTAVINDKIVVVSLVARQELGDPATRHYSLDSSMLVDEFNTKIKSLKLYK